MCNLRYVYSLQIVSSLVATIRNKHTCQFIIEVESLVKHLLIILILNCFWSQSQKMWVYKRKRGLSVCKRFSRLWANHGSCCLTLPISVPVFPVWTCTSTVLGGGSHEREKPTYQWLKVCVPTLPKQVVGSNDLMQPLIPRLHNSLSTMY